ncbi:MarR family transcriptional regulator [Pseudomarimonas arenosa]|uniref:MarR family transcriptional regulator n=1 Tax=Pseudomarimonas arenosa TaxID=2774145 RepID=A0AAW3ZNE9_9GAMM|nr:MarR family transcriptional regulator [Pseudomarimonas arenosa]MBD8527059.1 hypothetical protein [Pseudomarimonas arenosa]
MNPEIDEGFRKICQSLKLARRAELIDPDTNDPLIDSLYVDALPNGRVLKSALDPQTTFFVGRKGCGKSTVFQKLQSEISRSNHSTSAYIDIKTVFESCQIDPALLLRLSGDSDALPQSSLEKLLLQKAFLEALIGELRTQIRRKFTGSIWAKLRGLFGSHAELDAQLEDLVRSLAIPSYENVAALLRRRRADTKTHEKKNSFEIGADISDASGSFSASAQTESSHGSTVADEFSEVFLRTLNIKDFIAKLREFLARSGYSRLYVLIDDFSELPMESMRFVVDVLLSPLNNWSEELVKFKIAAYPGRLYFGQIDKTKIDEVHLDLFRLYGGSDVSTMEDAAIDFTRRLVEVRFNQFLPGRMGEIFAHEDLDIWRQLFYASMANPRVLGYVLDSCADLALIKGRRISMSVIQDAAEKYYREKIEEYFRLGKFLHGTFAERLSVYSLRELLEDIVRRAKELRQHSSDVFGAIEGAPFTSHFHIPTEMEGLLRTLELNFFVTKYFEMTDRSGRRVSVYALHYGLCRGYSIRFGRPTGKREFRLYFVERVFDYSSLVLAFLNRNQEISCNSCAARFPFEKLEAIKMFRMKCPECETGQVSVVNLSQKYAGDVAAVSSELLLDKTELGILATLQTEGNAMRPGDVAMELDCSHQLVGRRAKSLAERKLIDRPYSGAQRTYVLNRIAVDAYFSPNDRRGLSIEGDSE